MALIIHFLRCIQYNIFLKNSQFVFFLDNCSLSSWINDYADDHNSDSEFDPSDHSDDDISMSDDSDDGDNLQMDPDDSINDDIPIELLNREDTNDNINSDVEDNRESETEEEDEVVAAFIAASSERNRNHPPNLSVGNVLIGGLSFHPNTNVIAFGLSSGDISMYVHFFLCLN